MNKRYKIGKILFTLSWVVLGALGVYAYLWLTDGNESAKEHVIYALCAWISLLSVGRIFMRRNV